jgi:hypothetical protein
MYLWPGSSAQPPAAAQDFVDHGAGSRAVESRGVATVQDTRGRHLVIALSNDRSPRGWLLQTDIDTGETRQIPFPEEVDPTPSLSAPFASYVSQRGRFYTGIGGVLMEYDPATEKWLYHGRPNPNPKAQLFVDYAFAEAPDGRIYTGTTFDCHLIGYDPETRQAVDYGQLDPQEQFLRFIATDSAGWVYCGIGNFRGNIVACNPATGEKRQMIPEAQRTAGNGWVFPSTNGKVYGTGGGKNWRLFEGVAEEIDRKERGPVKPTGEIGWTERTGKFADGRELTEYNLQDGWLEVRDPKTGQTRRLTFTYQATGGMGFTSLAAGPDGNVYGSTCHPMRFIRFAPDTGKLTDLGSMGKEVGNFCAMAPLGEWLAAVSYSTGIMHLYDPRRPCQIAAGEAQNPRELARWPKEIGRPRVCLAHPDGRHLIMAGFATDGRVGGGMGIYDLQAGQAELLTHEQLLPYHSTVTLQALPGGLLVGGTDVAAPGGGREQATEGLLYLFDFATRKVVFQTVPVPGARYVRYLEVLPDGKVCGLAALGKYFVFDPQTRQVVHTEDWSAHGPEAGLAKAEDGTVYALMAKAVFRLDGKGLTATKLATPPQPAKYIGPILGGRLYYAADTNLWSYRLPTD